MHEFLDAFPTLAARLDDLRRAEGDGVEPAMVAVQAVKAAHEDALIVDHAARSCVEAIECEAVDRALAAGQPASALRLLDLLPHRGDEREALRAHLADDNELALALEPVELPALCRRIAARLRGQDREHRLLAAWLSGRAGLTEAAACQDAQSVEDDPQLAAIALYRVIVRRRSGADAEVFERLCVRAFPVLAEPRGLRELHAALCFRNVVERGSARSWDLMGAVRHAVEHDAVEPLRAALATLTPRRAQVAQDDLERQIASSRAPAAGAAAAPAQVALDGTEALTLGDFIVESGLVRVGDPCNGLYDPALEGRFEAVNGTWRAVAYLGTLAGLAHRCRLLLVHHEAHEVCPSDPRWHRRGVIAVDSGMAGVFDAYHFGDDALVDASEARGGDGPWCSRCARLCLDETAQAGPMPFGAVASSGLGDGIYPVWVAHGADDRRLDGGVVGVCVGF
ncbi:MAG: hypothetical protein OZ921_21830 [Sorangiineae bacterium]|nr:hypothetical protein [Polyangiaceae bacterium]MEB2325169.1 hypothetical protein [Sorangiineae bacterium]